MKTLVVTVALLGMTGWYHLREARTPNGQPPLVELNDDLSALKAEFNAAQDRTRVIISVAPSCPYCLKGASELQHELGQAEAAFFVVWQPILPTDWGKPKSWALARMSDPNVRQYWDPEHRIAAAIRQTGEAHETYPQCCYEGEVWWDLMAVFPPGEVWGDSLPKPVFIEGTVEDAIPQLMEALR